MTLLLVGLGAVAYLSMGRALLDEIDSGLEFRAAATLASSTAFTVERPNPKLQQPREAFAQLITRRGHVVRARFGFNAPLLFIRPATERCGSPPPGGGAPRGAAVSTRDAASPMA